MSKVRTEKTERTDTRSLSAEEIDCVVGGVMMTPDGRSCTERKMPRWPVSLPNY